MLFDEGIQVSQFDLRVQTLVGRYVSENILGVQERYYECTLIQFCSSECRLLVIICRDCQLFIL